jgi:DNA-binding PucR family transcriptional regulator
MSCQVEVIDSRLCQICSSVGNCRARPRSRLKDAVSTDPLHALASSAQLHANGKAQLSNLYSIFALTSLMFDGRAADSILALAADAVPSLSRCQTEATYLLVNGLLTDGSDPGRKLDRRLDSLVTANLGVDQPIVMPSGQWRYAITLRGVNGLVGAIVVCAPVAALPDELFLLKVLAQQTAAAMTSAALHQQERAQRIQLRDLTEERQRTIHQLSETVAELKRRDQIHTALTAVSGSGAGEAGIADALHQLTSLSAAVEDIFGNLCAWSGGPRPTNYRPVGGDNREEVVRRSAAQATPTRDGARLFYVIRPQTEVLGIVLLHDPKRRADRLDAVALEYAATVLAVKLSHQRALAETELRLRRDLIEDLLAGTEDDSAYLRAEALGHNLRVPHHITVLHWIPAVDSDLIAKAAQRWANSAGLHPLTARRLTTTIVLTDGAPDPSLLHRAVSAEVGSDRGAVGVGSAAKTPSEVSRSFTEAQRALQVQMSSATPYGGRCFDDLGVYRILDAGDGRPEVREFVQEWLGKLLTYDRDHDAELVKTLTRYLDAGGNYDQTAQLLNIHRSTLRYRLSRIREISERDLQDVDTRLNLHLATKIVNVTGISESATQGHGGG